MTTDFANPLGQRSLAALTQTYPFFGRAPKRAPYRAE